MLLMFVRLYNVDIFVLMPVRSAALSARCSVLCSGRQREGLICKRIGVAYVNFVRMIVL